jgi:hypothetical protein
LLCGRFTIRHRFVNHYFPVESHKLYLSRPGFVNVQTWKNIIKKLNITIMFPFYDLFKVVFDLQIDKKTEKNTNLS